MTDDPAIGERTTGDMTADGYLIAILDELASNARRVQPGQLDALADELDGVGHVFCAGAGRSGLAVRAFANRLLHLGISVSVVGDITSPHSQPGDLLLIVSGSGETGSLVALAEKARATGIRIALVTMAPESSISRVAETVVVLPGASPKLSGPTSVPTIQPMGSSFEQFTSLALDAVVLTVAARMGETTETMFRRHADLE